MVVGSLFVGAATVIEVFRLLVFLGNDLVEAGSLAKVEVVPEANVALDRLPPFSFLVLLPVASEVPVPVFTAAGFRSSSSSPAGNQSLRDTRLRRFR